MTDRSIHPRLPDGTERVVTARTEPRPDGSTVLTLVTVGPPLVLVEHRMFLDQYLTHSLLHTLARDLDGIEPPGPTPEAAALLAAMRTGDRTALATAQDAYNTRVLNLWTDTDGSAAA
ncbi:hypothetical protein PV735_07980 [Streptomyces turgidiscabies]|uniref:hypothetical protein n=1 Tax=Streptomyces TaxID=1883 RepID=UPI0002E49E6B|nr:MULTISPECIES: hypothetical protein [Streptomyces]MDX3492629.1 hypothetical protein [Streptomyces turgidiscabies]GAQ69075.1 hypothetical protein T45_00797 [Streptomyces turgidiscabies]